MRRKRSRRASRVAVQKQVRAQVAGYKAREAALSDRRVRRVLHQMGMDDSDIRRAERKAAHNAATYARSCVGHGQRSRRDHRDCSAADLFDY